MDEKHEFPGLVKRAVNIYLDTNLWNELCDQGVDPDRLFVSFTAKAANLVLSRHAVYELAKTFSKAPERGRKLFSYMREFVVANAPCTEEISGVLEAEMLSLRSRPLVEIRPFLPPENYSEFRQEIEKLANGDFDERANEFVNERSTLGSTARTGPARHLENRPDIQQRLSSVLPSNLEQWLENETMTPQGRTLLADQITRHFSGAPIEEAMGMAIALIASPACRLARGLVRADLYYNWRCSHRGSLPKDLYHDIFHVLNAIYCDVYATKEAGQQEYANLLLTPKTRVAIYDRQSPLDHWLQALA